MHIRLIGIVLCILILAGCTGGTRTGGLSAGLRPGPEIGVITDENLRVIAIVNGSAAEAAGLQVGDILVDLTWIPTGIVEDGAGSGDMTSSEVASSGEGVSQDAGATPVVEQPSSPITGAVPAATLPVEQFIEHGPIPFTEDQRIIYQASYGVPLTLRLIRDDQELELTIIPTRPVGRFQDPNAPELPTVTPIPPSFKFF